MAIFQLNDELWFPNPYLGEEDGLVAIGGDLSPERLILAYCNGFFPWYSFNDLDEPLWYCPTERFVIFPDEIHISHSMRTLLNKNKYQCTFNRAFDRVIRECGVVDDRESKEGAWLGPQIIEAYTEMHRLGLARSVEVWDGDRLVGGLYGIQIKNAFVGESMFSRVPSGSKLALIHLARIARDNGWHFIDCQLETPHLRSMGARFIPYSEYMSLLNSREHGSESPHEPDTEA